MSCDIIMVIIIIIITINEKSDLISVQIIGKSSWILPKMTDLEEEVFLFPTM